MSKNYKFSHYIFPLMLTFLSMNTIAAINVYGPGGPAPAMHEAAKQFQNKTGVDVHVTAGPTPQWADKAKLDADVIYSGSEAMMSDLESVFTDKIVKDSIEPLYLRPAAILVRKGNPKHIQGFKDLSKPNQTLKFWSHMAQAKWACGKILQVEQVTFSSQNHAVKISPCMHPIQAQRKKHGKRTAAMMHGWYLIFGESVIQTLGKLFRSNLNW